MRRALGCFGGLVGYLVVFAFVGVISSCLIVFAIWPGELKLFAPIFCTDAQPDAFVVTDTVRVQPGETNTNFTLYCMGPRGDATDVGLFAPFMLASVVNGVVLMVPLTIALVLGATGLRRATKGPSDMSGGFDDDRGDDRGDDRDDDHDDDDGDGDRRNDSARERPGRALPPPGSTAGPFVS